ncbi:hypothetical protein D6D29_10240, partial [Aureobasidium pullulans]
TTFVIVVVVVVVSPFSPFFLLQRADGRITRIEEYLDIESMSSPSGILGSNDSLTHMTQDQDDHHDSSSSSSEDDEDVIRPKHSASRRDPQSKTSSADINSARFPTREREKEKRRRGTRNFYTHASQLETHSPAAAQSASSSTMPPSRMSITSSNTRTVGLRHCHGYGAAPPAVETSRPSELNGSRKGYIHLRAQTRPAPTAHRAPDSDHNNDYQTAPLLASVNDHQEEPSRAPITRSAARSLCIEVTPINLSNDDDPSPFSKAKRGNNSRETGKSSPKRSCSNEDDGSPTKPAWWTSQKRNNGRFSS